LDDGGTPPEGGTSPEALTACNADPWKVIPGERNQPVRHIRGSFLNWNSSQQELFSRPLSRSLSAEASQQKPLSRSLSAEASQQKPLSGSPPAEIPLRVSLSVSL